MRLLVTRAVVPDFSSVGQGVGLTDDNEIVHFAGDHRPMRDIVEALDSGEEIYVEIDDWQILGRGGRV